MGCQVPGPVQKNIIGSGNRIRTVEQLEKADRLYAVTQRVGFTLWQLQELEGVAATAFVLLAQATRGIGTQAGDALVEKALSKTFGGTVSKLRKAGVLPESLEIQLQAILKERNWLVHQSRATSRLAIHSDVALRELLLRLDRLADSALEALRSLGEFVEVHGRKHGVSQEYIDRIAANLLKQWTQSNESELAADFPPAG
jgi:uncharacterized protein YutE (UPF0331/DUF86 family)